jgi:hypothetical protein
MPRDDVVAFPFFPISMPGGLGRHQNTLRRYREDYIGILLNRGVPLWREGRSRN